MDLPQNPVIDCDVHAVVPAIAALVPYLPVYWREQISQAGFNGPVDRWYPPQLPTSARADAKPSDGSPAASHVALIVKDVLEAAPHPSIAVLNCDYAVETLHNPDAALAYAQAVNEWLAAEWLARDSRLRASIVVPSQFPELAVREIERLAGRSSFVQVLLPVRSEQPYGSRNFRPVFAAAARHGLPVALHFGGAPGNASTPVGWPSLYLEEYAGMSGVFQTQLISLIAGGVFDEHPELKLVLAEGGFAWLPSLLWRFDKNWKGLRREIPWVRRPPSDYARDHVRLTIAPADAPPSFAEASEGKAGSSQLIDVIDQLGSDEMLLYASDYPHAPGDTAADAVWAVLSPALLKRIRSDNPRALYRL
jgi:predicted TIM-barrel fold metal-dependent hydrolase